jgi:hypothetical protein
VYNLLLLCFKDKPAYDERGIKFLGKSGLYKLFMFYCSLNSLNVHMQHRAFSPQLLPGANVPGNVIHVQAPPYFSAKSPQEFIPRMHS